MDWLDPESKNLWDSLSETSVDISVEQDGSLRKIVIKDGLGDETPYTQDEVTVHYVGSFLNGTHFDNSRDRGEALTFKIDDGRVVRGWDICMATMKIGEQCRLLCGPQYAYGQKGLLDVVPPNTPVVFEIEMLRCSGEDVTLCKDGGVIKRVKQRGQGQSTPNLRSEVSVHVLGMYQSSSFYDKELAFTLGDGHEQGIPCGVEKAIKKMRKGEKCSVQLSSKYGFGTAGFNSDDANVPPNAHLEYEIYLKDFVRVSRHLRLNVTLPKLHSWDDTVILSFTLEAKDQWELTPKEKLSLATENKIKGSERYKQAQISQALSLYRRGCDLLDDDPNYSAEDLAHKSSLLLALHLNCALCQLKLKMWNAAKDSCDFALSYDSDSEKAYFRRGQACMGQLEWLEASVNFERALQINAGNKSARQHISECEMKMKTDGRMQQAIYKGMFDRFADDDRKKEAIRRAKGQLSEEPIGYWSNDMANGMLSLEQEMEAFGERMPPSRSRRSSSGNEDDSSVRQ